MATLIWKDKKEKTETKRLTATSFKNEEQFEKLVSKTPEILDSVFLLDRQVRGGNKDGIPDIVGIDDDGNICIVELKNKPVDADIIPQLLKYALWAETSPDSIKTLWLEKDTPEDLSINWNSVQVRIIVIAPKIKRATLDYVRRIAYDVELIEVTQWIEGNDVFLLVDRLETDKPSARVKPTGGLPVYDEAFYKNERNPNSVDAFLKYVQDVQNLISAKQWNLETKFNQNYCSFKSDFFNAFGIKWLGTRSFAFFVHLPPNEAKKACPELEWHSSTDQKRVVYPIAPGKTTVSDYEKLFQMAYDKRTAPF